MEPRTLFNRIHRMEALESQRLKSLKAALKATDLLPHLLSYAEQVPKNWAAWPINRCLWYLRKRSRLTQAQLAKKAGIARSQLARFESGHDLRLASLRRIFAALEFGLILLPRSDGGHPIEPWDHQPD